MVKLRKCSQREEPRIRRAPTSINRCTNWFLIPSMTIQEHISQCRKDDVTNCQAIRNDSGVCRHQHPGKAR